jgi:tetratricopeptide (TPR) repeat protein/predicted transcriptional regulator/energy-coupling factor transporter ATP-binding protein EcfA2
MTVEEEPEEVGILARRADVVELLTDGPMDKPSLVETSEYSRSTVDRAIRDLDAAGYVVRGTEGYVATQAGRLAVERYRDYLADQGSIIEAADVLEAMPPSADPPIELVTDGRIETEDAAHELFELLASELEAADAVALAVPALVDTRHLRVCHARVARGDLEATVHAPEDVLADVAAEFPSVWAELAANAAFTARPCDRPPFGFVLTTVDGSARSVTLFTTDGGTVSSFLSARSRTATDWARSWLETATTTGEDVAAVVQEGTEGAALAPYADERLPATLRTQGFVRIDEAYYDRREPLDPASAWRAGLDVAEVAAGYAAERSTGDPGEEGQSLSDDLRSRLLAGTDVTLVGSQGSGKSTTCKTVAQEWHAEGHGTVLYRESGRGQPVEATTLLASVLDRAADHVLVVVEDAVRPEANDVFEVIDEYRGRDDVSFLLDAREREWRDPAEFPADARLRAVRQETVETVTVPRLGEADCERLRECVESVAGDDLAVAIEDVVEDVREAAPEAESATPGVMTLLFRRIARRIDPTRRPDAATTLDEVVDGLRDDLGAIGDAALDVGVLINALNATGLRVSRAPVHALAAGGHVRDEDLEAALDAMAGTVLFAAPATADGTYRTVHETWSARFLERLAEDDPVATARRFGRVLTAFLALADDPDRRDAVSRRVPGARSALEDVTTAPTEWADETVATLFGLGRSYPKLAALFWTTDGSAVRLPEACSTETRVRAAEWRGRIALAAEDLDRAEREFRRLEGDADRLSGHASERARARSLLGRSEVALRRGRTEAAADHARDALDLAEDISADVLRARTRRQLGSIAETRGDFDAAREQYVAALDLERAVGDRDGLASTHERIGGAAMKQGRLETARDHLERALDRFRETDDRSGEAECLSSLGGVAMKRNELDEARRYLHQGLDRHREIGDRQGQSASLSNLGLTALRAGDPEQAREYFTECLAIDREIGDRHGEAQTLNCLGEALQRVGHLAEARRHLETCLEVYRDVGDSRGEAFALGSLGTIARREGDVETARDRHERSLELKREVGNEQGEATSLDNLGLVARIAGDLDAARQHHQDALELQRANGDRHGEALTLVHLGRVASEDGDRSAARERYREALEVAGEAGVAAAEARASRYLGALARERGDVETARDHFERALCLFADKGYRLDELETRADVLEMAVEAGLGDLAHEQYRLALDRFDDVEGRLARERERVEAFFEGSGSFPTACL